MKSVHSCRQVYGICFEFVWLFVPMFVYTVEECQTFYGLYPFAKIMSINKAMQVIYMCVVCFVVIHFTVASISVLFIRTTCPLV